MKLFNPAPKQDPREAYLEDRIKSPTFTEIIAKADWPTDRKIQLQTMLSEYPNLSAEDQKTVLKLTATLAKQQYNGLGGDAHAIEMEFHDALTNVLQKNTHNESMSI